MQNIWSTVDLLRRNPHWWSPITSSAYGINLESKMLDKILYVVGKRINKQINKISTKREKESAERNERSQSVKRRRKRRKWRKERYNRCCKIRRSRGGDFEGCLRLRSNSVSSGKSVPADGVMSHVTAIFITFVIFYISEMFTTSSLHIIITVSFLMSGVWQISAAVVLGSSK
jgi:hypothetical protein